MANKKLDTAFTEESSKNIFDEFSTDSSLINEIEKIKEEQQKDLFYYFSLLWKIFQKIFILFFILIILSYVYIYIQKSKSFSDSPIIDPICSLFVDWSVYLPENTTYCSSITYLKDYYSKELSTLKTEQTKKILDNIVKVYEQDNFLKTKEVTFLLNKSENKISNLDVLEKFDILKNEFSWIDKSKIQCNTIEINTNSKYLKMRCYSYSQWYEKWIIWFSWRKNYDEIWWTSISIANSFLNYIDKNSTDFTLVERQKIFTSENVVWATNWYTNKTSFDVKLKINF